LRRIRVPGGIFGRMIAGFQGNRSYIPLACDDTFSRAVSADAPGEQFENATREWHDWKLLLLACRGGLLVLHEGVCLMTAHTRLAFHEWIRLQLCHLIGVTVVACA
jgi:hypothetical protein